MDFFRPYCENRPNLNNLTIVLPIFRAVFSYNLNLRKYFSRQLGLRQQFKQEIALALETRGPQSTGPLRQLSYTKGTLALALIGAVISLFLDQKVHQLAVLVVSGLLLVGLAVYWAQLHLFDRSSRALAWRIKAVLEDETHRRFLVDKSGVILHRNTPAREASLTQSQIKSVLAHFVADTDATFSRVQNAVRVHRRTSETLVTRKGAVKLSVTRIEHGLFLWDIHEETNSQKEGQISALPTMKVDDEGAIVFMNKAARDLFGNRFARLSDMLMDEDIRLGDLNTLRAKSGVVSCFVQSVSSSQGRQDLCLIPANETACGHMALTFDDMPIATLKLSRTGEILLANRAARRLIGQGETKGVLLPSLLEGLGRPLRDWLRETAEGRIEASTEFLRLKHERAETYLQVTLGLVPGDQSGALYALLNDATELKTLEAQFVQSQKMQAIGQLAGGVAHDFNNLLTAITGHCDLLLLRHDKGDEDFADLTQISQNANRAASLVGQLLAYSRKQTLKPEVCNLQKALAELSHLLNRLVGDNYHLDVTHESELNAIRVDRQQFEQVIMNLVVNARDAMKKGGKISITTRNLRLEAPMIRDRATVPVGDYVVVEVSDTGIGIPDHTLQQVFEPFYTTKPVGKGTGLGLSTVYGIVKQSGGFVFVDSTLGQGTCLRLIFPAVIADTIELEPEKTMPLSLTPAVSGTVLLVEDEAPVRAFAARALRIKGLTVIEAGSADEALSALEDSSLYVDLIVTDVIMPGMDGPTWVRQARLTRPDTPVIFVSGYADEKFSESRKAIGNSTFLPKPFSLAQLTATVDGYLTQIDEALV